MNSDELKVKLFVADEVRIYPGTKYWAKSFSVLAEPLYLKEDGDYYVVKFEDNKENPDSPLFYVGDYIYLRGLNWSSTNEIYECWFKVTSIWMDRDKPYKYIIKFVGGDKVTADVDPGSVFASYGQLAADDYVDLETLNESCEQCNT